MSINTIFKPRIDILYIALALISFIMRKMAIYVTTHRDYMKYNLLKNAQPVHTMIKTCINVSIIKK